MTSGAWMTDGERTIARMLTPQEIRTWLRNDLVVGPSEAAVLIKDGKAEEVITEERRALGNWADRNLPTFKRLFSTGTDYRAFVVSTLPFDLMFNVNMWTMDQQMISGQTTVRCSVLTDDAARLTAMLGRDNSIATFDLLNRIKPELASRIFQPAVAGKLHDEIRGNVAFLRELEDRAREELRQTLGAWSIRVDNITVVWGLTEQEKLEIARRAKQLEEEEKDFTQARMLRELERKAEAVRTAQQLALEQRKRVEAGELEIQGIRLDAKHSAEEKQAAMRLRLAEVNAEIAQLDTDLKLAQLAVDREQDRIAMDRKRDELALIKDKELFDREQDRLDFEMIQQNKRERMREEQEHQLTLLRNQQESNRLQMDMQMQQMAVQLGMIERIIGQGLAAGAVDAATLQKMLEEQTKMRALDRGDAVAGSVFTAEAAKHSMDAMKQAEDRERLHQQQMTRLSGEMMQASKQQVPLSGASPASGSPVQPSVHIVNVPPASGPAAECDAVCPGCGKGVQKTWKACPFCGKALDSAPK